MRKLVYLKYANIPKFITTLSATNCRRIFSSREESSAWAIQ